jgi:RNA polymerase sigma factor (sigma-70 family)
MAPNDGPRFRALSGMGDVMLRDWFKQEILPLEPLLTRFLQRNWRDQSEIEDLRQEAYVRVFDAARHERPRMPKAFLFQITKNLMIDALRRKSIISLDSMTDLEWRNVSDKEPSAEAFVSARQELQLLQNALNDLPPRCREVVIKRKVQGFSQKEVSEQMGIAVVTVENQVAIAMRLLAEALGRRRGVVVLKSRRLRTQNRPSNVD